MVLRRLLIVAASTTLLLAGSPAGPGVGAAAAQDPATQPPAQAAPLSPEAMDQLLGPIALYPDSMVAQIMLCAASPYQVRQVNTWLKAHPDLQGTASQEAAMAEGFDASFIAMVLFPQVIAMMDEQAEWTRQLGVQFSSNRSAVFESIQRLRKQAHELGNLKTNEQQQVNVETTGSGQQVIVIQPANPQVIYVPQYDPQVVYVQPVQTIIVEDDDDDVLAAGVIGFTTGIIVGIAIGDDDDWCGGWGWHGGCCYDDAWDDFYDHREDMANDWYEHREDMAGIRDDRREERQDNRGDRVDTRDQRQGDRQTTRDDRQGDRAGTRDQRQGDRAGTTQTRRPTTSTNAARGRTPTTTQRAATRPSSGGLGGYSSGRQTRAASSRGRSSMGASRGGSRGGARGGRRR
jgi:hypothetical protein